MSEVAVLGTCLQFSEFCDGVVVISCAVIRHCGQPMLCPVLFCSNRRY
jgi:hypothetical protein